MGFKEQVSLDLNRTEFRDWGEDVSYTPSGGEAVTITAIVHRDQADLEPTEDGLQIKRHVPVLLQTADVSTPARGDVIAFAIFSGGDAVNWNVTGAPLVIGDGTALIEVFRRERVEKTAEAHRLRI